MRNRDEYSYYYQCVPESFMINTDAECISIDHFNDKFQLAFYEISEIGIDFSEENDYILQIHCWKEHHMFQFVNKKDAVKVCIEILNQISLLPEHRDTSVSS